MPTTVLRRFGGTWRYRAGLALLSFVVTSVLGAEPRPSLHRTVDLNLGEVQQVMLWNGKSAKLKLLDVVEVRDSLRGAVRQAHVTLEVNGVSTILASGNYHLPVAVAGVQLDCPVTRGYRDSRNHRGNVWALEKDARLRVWPAGSPWIEPGSFTYPLKQRWFASMTQAGNEPTYVDGGDDPANLRLYYHAGCDLGGAEGRAEVVAASDGLIVFAHGTILPEYADLPFHEKLDGPDLIFVLEGHGWMHRYAHLKDVEPSIRAGQRVQQGQRLGRLGKEGGSGGWSHLHFDIRSRQPSGEWGHQDGYAFLWEAYQREHQPKLIAVARPHHLVVTGEKVLLDGSRSWSATDGPLRYEWILAGGSKANSPIVERHYERPGSYSEILKATDAEGRVDYDFCVVQVIDKSEPGQLPPTIHASYAPTFGIKPSETVTFKVRTFRTQDGQEAWDFGDGSPVGETRSDGNANAHAPDGYATIEHRYERPGLYLVSVQRTDHNGASAVARLQVRVGEDSVKPTADRTWEPWLERKLFPVGEGQAMMQRFLEKQLEPVPRPLSREAWLSARESLRRKILAVVGIDDLVPAKWNLHLQPKGTLQRDGYRLEKFTYESYPGMAVPALLYVPQNVPGRLPGIVSISGHTPASKAADYVQQRNINLALRGCVVLAYDYYGYGERKTGDNPNRPEGANAHDMRTFSFSRRSATALELLDAIRAVDVLAARPEVDVERIGFTGESGGANTTYWMAALDGRVKLAVPVCSVTTFDYWIRFDKNWDWHQRPPGIRRLADIGTLLALHAPNPLLIISSKRGTDDEEFPLDEAEKSYQWARHVYRLLDAEEAASHHESITGHGYQDEKRELLYRAVERWLKPPRLFGGKEQTVQIESAESLRCLLPENNLTLRDVHAEWVKVLPRADQNHQGQVLRAFLRQQLGWPQPLPALKAEKMGGDASGQWRAQFWSIETEPGVRLPAVCISPKSKTDQGVMVLISGRDKQAAARALEAGHAIVAFDLRGIGELRHGKSGHWASMMGRPWSDVLGDSGGVLANWSWFAGRPLAGQWALDLVQLSRFCRETLGATSLRVDARTGFGWPALLAGAAAPEHLVSGHVEIPWDSLHDILHARRDAALADVPGLLEYLDVPQLRELWPGGEVVVKP